MKEDLSKQTPEMLVIEHSGPSYFQGESLALPTESLPLMAVADGREHIGAGAAKRAKERQEAVDAAQKRVDDARKSDLDFIRTSLAAWLVDFKGQLDRQAHDHGYRGGTKTNFVGRVIDGKHLKARYEDAAFPASEVSARGITTTDIVRMDEYVAIVALIRERNEELLEQYSSEYRQGLHNAIIDGQESFWSMFIPFNYAATQRHNEGLGARAALIALNLGWPIKEPTTQYVLPTERHLLTVQKDGSSILNFHIMYDDAVVKRLHRRTRRKANK